MKRTRDFYFHLCVQALEGRLLWLLGLLRAAARLAMGGLELI